MSWARHIVFNCITLTTALYGCTGQDSPECASALGDIIAEERSLDSFNQITLSGRLDINLIQDTLNWAEVEFGEGLTDGIITNVKNNTLFISEENSCDWIRDQKVNPTISIHYSNLKKIISQSSASVIFENEHTTGNLSLEVDDVAGSIYIRFDGDSIRVNAHTGATDITIEGNTHFAYIYNSSYAPIDAKDLHSIVSVPHNNLTGNILVRASDRVSYQIFDDGDIIVFGNPSIIEKWYDQGKGELILKN